MIDLQRIHHIGMIVADVPAAQASMGAALGLEWAPVRTFDPLPFWTPERGSHDTVVRATYSRGDMHRLELVQGDGAFFDPGRRPDARHIGVWTSDLTAEAERLCALGWRVEGAGASPAEDYGVIVYLTPPGGGLMIELISTLLEEDLRAWTAG